MRRDRTPIDLSCKFHVKGFRCVSCMFAGRSLFVVALTSRPRGRVQSLQVTTQPFTETETQYVAIRATMANYAHGIAPLCARL